MFIRIVSLPGYIGIGLSVQPPLFVSGEPGPASPAWLQVASIGGAAQPLTVYALPLELSAVLGFLQTCLP